MFATILFCLFFVFNSQFWSAVSTLIHLAPVWVSSPLPRVAARVRVCLLPDSNSTRLPRISPDSDGELKGMNPADDKAQAKTSAL